MPSSDVDRTDNNEKPTTVEAGAIDYSTTGLKLDPHGFPLHPQPSSDPHDPLNWNPWFKGWVLLQVSVLSMLSPMTQAIINSAYGELAKHFGISIQHASYTLTVAIITSGVFPLIWSPLSNVYGRRPIFVFVSILGIVGHAASGAAKSWGGLLVARAFMGIGTSAGSGIGYAVVADLYFMHERGRYTGYYVLFVQNGAHIAGLIGGFVAQAWGFRWCFWLPTIIWGVNWLVNVFCLPETLYHRENRAVSSDESGDDVPPQSESWMRLFTFNSRAVKRRHITTADWFHVVRMARYPSVFFPTLYYAICFGVGTVLFAVTGAAAFGSIYHFSVSQIGMVIGLPTLIGSIIGEICAGPVSDWILYAHTKRNNGVPTPEVRLHAVWPGWLLMPIGVIIEGVCLQYRTHWIGPAMGMGIALFGLQIIATNCFAYMLDCYRPQSAELSTIINFGRQVFSFTLGFYMLPFAAETTYGIAWAVMAIISMVLFIPVIVLMWKGKEWREKLGDPDFDQDI